LPLLVLFVVSLIGISGLVIDIGGWYVQKQQVQAAADAGALAGATQLPAGWSYAQTAGQGEWRHRGRAHAVAAVRPRTAGVTFPCRKRSGRARLTCSHLAA